MNENKVRKIRETLGYTQADLSEQTNLSIRTIQRVESGQSIPKGHTLKVLAEVLGVDKKELQQQVEETGFSAEENLRIKFINLASLCFLGIPFGNLLIPFFIWSRKKDRPAVEEIIKRILNFQIIWTVCTCLLLIISPFLQVFFFKKFTLILFVGFMSICVNLFFIFKTAISLSRSEYDILPLKLRLL